jgi:hypothetical protein
VRKLSKVLIIVDADSKDDPNPNRGYDASKNALEQLIIELGFKISIDYYIMCDENKEGNLESFLLSVLDEEQKECINTFKSCYQYELSDKWVYNSFYKQKNHPFDFEHENFKELKTKLEKLFEKDLHEN